MAATTVRQMPEENPDDDQAANDEKAESVRGDEFSLSDGRDEIGAPDAEEGDEESAPLSDLRADVEQRREADAASDEEFEELFTEMEVGGVDEDTVWEELSEAAETPTVEPGTAVADEEPSRDARDVTVVEKRLCHTCPHFSDPPETACTHEGTTIEAEVDVDHFRVADCPVVAAREDIDEMEASDFSDDGV